jgi:hypothetical protein
VVWLRTGSKVMQLLGLNDDDMKDIIEDVNDVLSVS